MPAGPLPHPPPGCQVQAHKGPDGALLAQPPLPAAPSRVGHEAKEELGALGARGHHGEGGRGQHLSPSTRVHISQSCVVMRVPWESRPLA